MRIDMTKLKQIAELDDRSFAQIVQTVILAAGGSEQQAREAVRNAPELKAKLRFADEKELSQAVSLIGRGKADQVIQNLTKKSG